MAVPLNYVKLLYLKCTGKQYIDTSINLKDYNYFKLSFRLYTDFKDWNGFFTNTSNNSRGGGFISQNNNGFHFKYNNVDLYDGSKIVGRHNLDFEFDHGTIREYLDGVQCANTKTVSQISVNDLLRIGRNWNTYFRGNIFEVKFSDENHVLFDFLPCINEQNIPGFYEDVNGVFYRSASSTAFEAGPELVETTYTLSILGEGSVIEPTGPFHQGDSYKFTAVPSENYIFGAWYVNGIYFSNQREAFIELNQTNEITAKFIDAALVGPPVLRRNFKVYKKTVNAIKRSDSDVYVQDVELTIPRILSSLKTETGATFKTILNETGWTVNTNQGSVFNGHIENHASYLQTTTTSSYINNFFPNVMILLSADKELSNNYVFVDEQTQNYFTIYLAAVDHYGTGYFFDKNDNQIFSMRALYSRDHSPSNLPIAFRALGFTGFKDGTIDEESSLVMIQCTGTGAKKDVQIVSDQEGNPKGIPELLGWFIGQSDEEEEDSNPYNKLGPSSTGGGDGSFSFPMDFTPIEELPERINALDSGFVKLYQMDKTTMNRVAAWMWSSEFFTAIRKFIEKPEDSIISLQILPVQLSSSEVTNEHMTAAGVRFYDAGHPGSTDPQYQIFADRVNNQFYIYDLGSITVPEVWGSDLDFQPYTQAEIYLPYIGVQAIDIDEISGRTLGLRYSIDLLSGDCVAFIAIDGNLKYQFSGNCRTTIPYSANTRDYLTSAITLAGGIAAASTGVGIAAAGAIAAGGLGLLKKDISHGSSVSGSKGFMSLQKPVLYLRRPSQNVPSKYNRFKGFPSNITAKIGDLSGYTEVDSIHLQNVPATMEEKDEIESILKGGFIV